jgi:hypothetical protein
MGKATFCLGAILFGVELASTAYEVGYYVVDERIHHINARIGVEFVSKKWRRAKEPEWYVVTKTTTLPENLVPIAWGNILQSYPNNGFVHKELDRLFIKLNLSIFLHEIVVLGKEQAGAPIASSKLPPQNWASPI